MDLHFKSTVASTSVLQELSCSREMDSSPGAGWAHREVFQLGMKGDGDETRLSEDEPGAAVP